MLLCMNGEARAGWERMLAAGPGGATLMVAAASTEQLDEMLSGLQDGQHSPSVRLHLDKPEYPQSLMPRMTNRVIQAGMQMSYKTENPRYNQRRLLGCRCCPSHL